MLTVHMISETEWVTQGQGVHTAYLELIQLLNEEPDVKIVTNGEGYGDVFHSHTYGPYYFYKGFRYKGRRILTAHVIPESSKGSLLCWRFLYPLTKWYLKKVYSFADVVIAISPEVEQSLKRLGINSKIIRIANPVLKANWKWKPENRISGRLRLNLSPDDQVVLGVGQLQERKGVEDFIDMAIAMPDKKFVWVGGRPWGWFTEGVRRIDERIAEAPSNIQFTGLIDIKRMPEMYAAADIFVFPSYQENCPLAPLEAASAGLPVIFRDIPEYRSLFSRTYRTAKTTKEFISIINELFENKHSYEISAELSNQLLLDFDKEKIKSRLLALYRETIKSALTL